MSSGSALEAEELENVPLVRMEDVQPDRSVEYMQKVCEEEVLETCIVDEGDYDNCVVDDDDSNIGSMVSIKSDDIDGEDAELIVPEVLDSGDEPLNTVHSPPHRPEISKQSRPDRWPTLEILPGGVINLADKSDSNQLLSEQDSTDTGEMMYACAKCSQSFKYLFCLVKHVRWHEDESRRVKVQDLTKLTTIEKKMAELERRSNELDKSFKNNKGPTDAPIEPKTKSLVKEKYICLHSGKRKIVSKPKAKRISKKIL